MRRAENESGNFGRGRAVGGTKRGHGIVLKVLPRASEESRRVLMMVGEIFGIWVRGCSDDSCGILLRSQSLWRNHACCVVREVVVERWNRLSDDELAFSIVEVVWRDFKVQLGGGKKQYGPKKAHRCRTFPNATGHKWCQ